MANTITSQYFLSLFPEFLKKEPASIEAFVNIASIRVAPKVWGAAAGYATALLTAHMLTASGRGGLGGGGGAIASESVGELSRGFQKMGLSGSGDEELQTTRYGIDYVALRRETIVGAQVTGTFIPPLGQDVQFAVVPVYEEREDFISNILVYKGEAIPGTPETQPKWRIKKVVISGTAAAITWALGNSNFDKIWTQHLTYTYF